MLIPTFEMTGQKAVNRSIKKLGPKIGKKPIRKGLRAGAKVFQVELKKRTPAGKSKQLRKQVKVRAAKRSRKKIMVLATMGNPKASNLNSGDGFYGAFANFGRGPGGWHKGNVKGTHFVEEAFESSKEKANRVAAETIASETNKELRK